MRTRAKQPPSTQALDTETQAAQSKGSSLPRGKIAGDTIIPKPQEHCDASISSPFEVHTGGIVHTIVVPFHVQVGAVLTAIVQELHEDGQGTED